MRKIHYASGKTYRTACGMLRMGGLAGTGGAAVDVDVNDRALVTCTKCLAKLAELDRKAAARAVRVSGAKARQAEHDAYIAARAAAERPTEDSILASVQAEKMALGEELFAVKEVLRQTDAEVLVFQKMLRAADAEIAKLKKDKAALENEYHRALEKLADVNRDRKAGA